MRRRNNNRSLYFLFLNVVISAVTVLVILWLWDRTHPAPTANLPMPTGLPDLTQIAASLKTAPAAAPEVSPTPLPPGVEGPHIVIESIIGAGDSNSEVVLLKRAGEGELNLTDWRLEDQGGNTFTFPALTLYKGGAVQVHTGAGVNTVVDLYWGRDTAVWSVGEVATLYDPQGKIQATFTIP